jgi:hypothetical protein
MCAVRLKKIIGGAAISGALGFTALGLGAGVANANPPAPVLAGIPSSQHNPGWFDPGARGYGSGPDCFMGPFWNVYCL